MKNFLILLMTFVCVSVFSAFGQQSALDIANIVQPSAHIEGSTISYTNGVYTLPTKLIITSSGTVNMKWGRAILLSDSLNSTHAGTVIVHLVGDASTLWFRLPLIPGGYAPALFDKIRQTGTTANLDSISIILTSN